VKYLASSLPRADRANLWNAATITACLVSRNLAWHITPTLGVLRHEGSAVIVGLNGGRLLGAHLACPVRYMGTRTWSSAVRTPMLSLSGASGLSVRPSRTHRATSAISNPKPLPGESTVSVPGADCPA
jgi:hypothetical protein